MHRKHNDNYTAESGSNKHRNYYFGQASNGQGADWLAIIMAKGLAYWKCEKETPKDERYEKEARTVFDERHRTN